MNKIISVCPVLFFLIVFASFSPAQDMDPEAARLYNEGTELSKTDKPKEAIVKYDSALAFSKDFKIYYQKGVAFRKLNNLDSAKTAFQASIAANPDFANSYYALGSVYFADNDLQPSIDNFTKALELSVSDTSMQASIKKTLSVAYYKLGAESIKGKKFDKAIEELKKSVEYNPAYDAGYLFLAKAYSETNKFDESLDAAQKALDNATTISKAGPYYYMGIAYKNKGDNAKAKEMFNQAKSDKSYKKAVEYELSLLK